MEVEPLPHLDESRIKPPTLDDICPYKDATESVGTPHVDINIVKDGLYENGGNLHQLPNKPDITRGSQIEKKK